MLGRTLAVGLVGLGGAVVEVEAQVAPGLPSFRIVGLPDASLGEARERVRAALTSCGLRLPDRRITVNLSPASLPKTGAAFDCAIAVAVVAAGALPQRAQAGRTVHIAELGLDGRLHPVRGVLPMVARAVAAGHPHVLVAGANAAEAALVPGAVVEWADHLAQVLARYGITVAAVGEVESVAMPPPPPPPTLEGDLADVVGQDEARLALEVAAAGGHHLSLTGPPGAGKTMLARRLPGILPDLGDQDAVAVTSIHSVAGTLAPGQGLLRRPPFEAPHHTASPAAVIGGGSGVPMPGAVSRAHCGVLFLDEAPEFAPTVLQTLRQPLESGEITLHRARAAARYPARFQLVLAANPCPCGADRACSCTPQARRRYTGRLGGPLLDRVDIRLPVRRVTRAMIAVAGRAESSAVVAGRVLAARERQRERWRGMPWSINARIPGSHLRGPDGGLDPRVRTLIQQAVDVGALTMRGVDRVLRVAWTLADLTGEDGPTIAVVGRALALRTGEDHEAAV